MIACLIAPGSIVPQVINLLLGLVQTEDRRFSADECRHVVSHFSFLLVSSQNILPCFFGVWRILDVRNNVELFKLDLKTRNLCHFVHFHIFRRNTHLLDRVEVGRSVSHTLCGHLQPHLFDFFFRWFWLFDEVNCPASLYTRRMWHVWNHSWTTLIPKKCFFFRIIFHSKIKDKKAQYVPVKVKIRTFKRPQVDS